MSKPIVELKDTIPFDYTIQLDEDRDGKNWLVVEGVFQRADAKNANGRIYPRKVLEGQIKNDKIVESLQKRSMLGELDHPDDGKTSLKRVSHIVTDLWLEDNGDCKGKALILNNPQGEILKELFRAGAQVGISSRGSGSVRNTGDGAIVQEDFKLNTFDFVVTPSTHGAYPAPTKESAPTLESEETDGDSMDEASRSHPVGSTVEFIMGVDSGKRGKVIHHKEVPTNGRGIPQVGDGSYHPLNAKEHVAVRLPDGSIRVSNKVHVKRVNEEDEETIQEYGYDDQYSDPMAGMTQPGLPHSGPAVAVDAQGHPVGQQTSQQTPHPQFNSFGCAKCGASRGMCVCGIGGDQGSAHSNYREEDEMNRGKFIEAMFNHTRRTERIVEAERTVAGRLLQALISRLRNVEPVVEYVEVEQETEDYSDRVEEMGRALAAEKIRAEAAEQESAQLKGALQKLKAKLSEAGETEQKVAEAVSQIVATNPDAADWVDYLSEAATVDEVQTRYRKLQNLTENEVLKEIRSLHESTSQKAPNSPDMDLFRRTMRVTQRPSAYAKSVKVHEI